MSEFCKHFTHDTDTARDGLGRCAKIEDYLKRGATPKQAEKVASEHLNGAYRTIHGTFLFVNAECNSGRDCLKFEAIEPIEDK